VYQTEKLISDMGEKISDEDKAGITAEMEKLKSVSVAMHGETMNESDTDTLKAAIETYTKALNDFSQKLYSAAAPDMPNAPEEPSDYGPSHDDSVIDGDFTEK